MPVTKPTVQRVWNPVHLPVPLINISESNGLRSVYSLSTLPLSALNLGPVTRLGTVWSKSVLEDS